MRSFAPHVVCASLAVSACVDDHGRSVFSKKCETRDSGDGLWGADYDPAHDEGEGFVSFREHFYTDTDWGRRGYRILECRTGKRTGIWYDDNLGYEGATRIPPETLDEVLADWREKSPASDYAALESKALRRGLEVVGVYQTPDFECACDTFYPEIERQWAAENM